MKKQSRKLELNRETIRNLDFKSLGGVVGAADPTQFCTIPVSNCAGTCASCPKDCIEA